MKKLILLIFFAAIVTASCASGPGAVPESSVAANAEEAASYAGNNKESASKTLDGKIKFYPTYDADYKTCSNEIFGFWFDIPNEWDAEDRSEDGTAYAILPGNSNVEIKIYGALKNDPKVDFYAALAGSGGTVEDFTYRDGWIGKKINASGNETYYVREDGDSYITLYISSKGDSGWMAQNAEKLNYIAMSVRVTRESYGIGVGEKDSVTPGDLRLGGIELGMSYEALIRVMGQKPEKEVEDNNYGIRAKTLFFADNTQIYMVYDEVYSVNVTSPEYATPRGLKAGDGADRLIELYGEPANKSDGGYWGYTYEGYELFTVRIEKNKVAEIQIDAAR